MNAILNTKISIIHLKKCTSTKKLFLDLSTGIKVIGSDVHASVYDTRNDFGFPIVNFPWLSCDVPRLLSYLQLHFAVG